MKRVLLLFIISFSFCFFNFAATIDLSQRFLDKANEAFEEDNIEDAYKYVNQALAVAKDEETMTYVAFFAQTVYKVKLQNIQKHYDDMALIDIKMNLEKYPALESTSIKKLINQIETEQNEREKKANSTSPQETIKKDSLENMDTYTIYVGLRINYLKINDTGYFQFNSDDYATVLEILPLEDNLCKVVISVPWNRAGSFQDYVIYIKKGDLLQTRTSSQIAIGVVSDFQYNQLSFLVVEQ